MTRLTDRRAILLAAGTAAAVAVSGAVAAQPTDIRGTVQYEGGAEIPKGQLKVYLENTAIQGNARGTVVQAQLESDGGTKAIAFSLAPLAGMDAASTSQIVAQLERADGWLLARGSAAIMDGEPVQIILYTVMY